MIFILQKLIGIFLHLILFLTTSLAILFGWVHTRNALYWMIFSRKWGYNRRVVGRTVSGAAY